MVNVVMTTMTTMIIMLVLVLVLVLWFPLQYNLRKDQLILERQPHLPSTFRYMLLLQSFKSTEVNLIEMVD